VINYIEAAIVALYSPDPLYIPPSKCVLPASDSCDEANMILLNRSRLGSFYAECSIATPAAGFITLDVSALFWTAITQTRRTQVPCLNSKSIDTNDCYLEELSHVFQAGNISPDGVITSPRLNTTITDMGVSSFSPTYLGSTTDFPSFVSFVPSGFLNTNSQITKCQVENLLNIGWIGRETKSVCIQNSYINSNENGVVGVFSICFESSLSGDIQGVLAVTSSAINTSSNSYTNMDTLVTILYTVVLSLNVCYVLFHSVGNYFKFIHCKIKGLKFHWRWKDFLMTSCDYITIIFQYAAISAFFVYFNKSTALFDDIASKPKPDTLAEFLDSLDFFQTNYQDLIVHYEHLYTMWSITILLTTYRTISMLSFHPDSALITETLARCAYELFAFWCVFFFIVCGYALVVTIRYGADIEQLASFGKSINVLLLVCFGEFSVMIEILDEEGAMEVFLVWSYVFLTTMLLLNILLSIVVESFLSFHDQREADRFLSFSETIQMSWQLLSCDMRYYCCLRKKKSAPVAELPSFPGPETEPEIELMSSNARLNSIVNSADFSMEVFNLRSEFRVLFSDSLVDKILARVRKQSHSQAKSHSEMFLNKSSARLLTANHKRLLKMVSKSMQEHQRTQGLIAKLEKRLEIQPVKSQEESISDANK